VIAALNPLVVVSSYIVLAALVALVVWAIMRARRGVANVMSLMARVEASSRADAHAAALASNRVVVNLDGNGARGNDYYDDLVAGIDASDVERYRLAQSRAGLRPGGGRVHALPTRGEPDHPMIGWTDPRETGRR
jgi:hypothetical protein